MSEIKVLDCTLRDGGYITNWEFKDDMIRETIKGLMDAQIDFIEVGYLNPKGRDTDGTQFKSIETIKRILPEGKRECLFLAMADVLQFQPEDLTECDSTSIEAIRVVFYKHQIEEAFTLGKAVKQAGYKLFMQPMVTIDYSLQEYAALVEQLAAIEPYGVSIVDSSGYMMKEDFRKYFMILDDNLGKDVLIGFHSHNNMNLAFITAQDVMEYETNRTLVLDASLYGMGRGAGNLQTELITNYSNMFRGNKYDVSKILALTGKYVLPVQKRRTWGYSPYMLITGMYHCHPNFACYLLEEYPNVSVDAFEAYIKSIPEEMKTKCRKPYVLEQWQRMVGQGEK